MYLGLDLGTSGLRALLVDDTGVPLGDSECAYTASHPQTGWSEQNPADWIAALEHCIAELKAKFPAFKALRGIGVSGQMHGATLLDAKGEVIRPCMLWNDTRAAAEAAEFDANPQFRARSGNIVFPGFTAPKLAWVARHEPEHFTRVAKVLLPAAYLNYYLTGDYVGDLSDSSGTSWLNVGKRKWSSYLLKASGMQEAQMPRLVDGSAQAGVLRGELAQKWGVGEVVVAGGAGDNAAAACGIGALKEGQGFLSLGTSGVVLVARDGYYPQPETAVHTFCHAVPDRWYQMGVMLAATDSLNWFSRITGKSAKELTQLLGDKLHAPSALRFYPYLSGERTPYNDAAIRAGFVGISQQTDMPAMVQAILEGVAFGLCDCLTAIKQTGVEMTQLTAIGGGAQSDYWLQMLATVLKVPLALPEGEEFGAALGAARLALCAQQKADVAEIMQPVAIARTISPVTSLTDIFSEKYHRFHESYARIKALSQ